MTAMQCDELIELAPELALDIVCGAQRAKALDHLDTCAMCQQVVAALAGVSDQLLLLARGVDPPAGFERKVLQRAGLTPMAPLQSGSRTTGPVAATGPGFLAAIALVIALGSGRGASAVTAPMRTSGGDVVGTVSLQTRPAVLVLDIPQWPVLSAGDGPGNRYEVRIERKGEPAALVPVAMNASGAWATALDFDAQSVTAVAMVDRQGRIWCKATLPAVR
jgi:hypothetical protein